MGPSRQFQDNKHSFSIVYRPTPVTRTKSIYPTRHWVTVHDVVNKLLDCLVIMVLKLH